MHMHTNKLAFRGHMTSWAVIGLQLQMPKQMPQIRSIGGIPKLDSPIDLFIHLSLIFSCAC